MDYNKMTDKQLNTSLEIHIKREKEETLVVLKHLLVVDARRMYADLGFSSLFSYLTDHWGYTRAEAYVRICALRLMKEVKGVTEKMEKGSLSLTNAKELNEKMRQAEEKTGKVLSEEKKADLLEKVEGKSTREVTQLLEKELFPERPVSLKKKLVLSLEEDLYAQLQRVKMKLGLSSEEELLKTLLGEKEAALEQKVEKLERVRKEKEVENEEGSRPSRYIRVKVKNEVLPEADYRCEFISPITGKRCEERRGLQFDHCRPFGLGGGNGKENIRVLCFSHNQRYAIRIYGLKKMEKYFKNQGSEVHSPKLPGRTARTEFVGP